MQTEVTILKSVVSAQVSVCNDLKQMMPQSDRALSLSSEHSDQIMSELFVDLPPQQAAGPSGSGIPPSTTPPVVIPRG